MKNFRIDNQYGVVYEYDENLCGYVFCGKFHTFGINPKMTEKKQLDKINEVYYQFHERG